MALSHNKPWTDAEFKETIGKIRSSAKQLWTLVTLAAVDAVLRYHEHSYDTSRCKSLDEALDQAGLRSHQTCFRALLQQATGITGIGGKWKHSQSKLDDQDEEWQEVLARIETEGLDSLQQRPGETKRGDGQKKARTSVKVEGWSKEERNALQKALDSAETPTARQAIVASIAAGTAPPSDRQATDLDVIPDESVREEMRSLALEVAELCQVEQVEGMTGPEKAKDLIDMIRGLVGKKLKAVTKAAEAEAESDEQSDAA